MSAFEDILKVLPTERLEELLELKRTTLQTRFSFAARRNSIRKELERRNGDFCPSDGDIDALMQVQLYKDIIDSSVEGAIHIARVFGPRVRGLDEKTEQYRMVEKRIMKLALDKINSVKFSEDSEQSVKLVKN